MKKKNLKISMTTSFFLIFENLKTQSIAAAHTVFLFPSCYIYLLWNLLPLLVPMTFIPFPSDP